MDNVSWVSTFGYRSHRAYACTPSYHYHKQTTKLQMIATIQKKSTSS